MAGPPGDEPDELLQDLAHTLMQAIGKSLRQSDQIREIVAQIETQGYEVSLILAALTRLVKLEEGADLLSAAEMTALTGKGEGTLPDPGHVGSAEFDRRFLRLAGIRGDLPA